MKIFVIICIIALVIWIIGSFLAVRNIEEPSYEVLSKTKEYEIRSYKNYIVASVEVDGNQREALNQGFRLLAGYIFGGNTSNTSISMTAPVSQNNISEKISMTVPVSSSQISGNKKEVTFSMPSKYTLSSLPIPNDSRVILKEIPAQIRAVHRYTLWSNEKRSEAKKLSLLKALEKNQVKTIGNMITQYYNPPFTIPFMRRNEVSVQIEQKD